MKKIGIRFIVLTAALLPVIWLSQGCKGTISSLPEVVPTPLPSSDISDFSNGTLNMNSTLFGSSTGYFLPETYGGAAGHTNMINGSTNPNILVSNPGTGSLYAAHVYGPQSDPSPTTYPAFQIFGFLKNDPSNLPSSDWFDLTQRPGFNFTGIRFDVKILPYSTAGGVTVGDNNPQKRFAIASAPMVPSTTDQGGTCAPPFSSNCYNYFWIPGNLPPTNPAVNNGWKPVSFLFSTMKLDSGYGGPFAGFSMTASPVFKQQALFLLWKFGDNGGGTDTYTDFWVDNVQFY